MQYNPIICAIDTKDIEVAKNIVKEVKPYVGGVKVGLEFFTANGVQGVKALKDLGVPFVLDLKYHDIPNTVAESVKAAVQLGAFMMTIHVAGGEEMMIRASAAAAEEASRLNIEKPIIAGVTVLTSKTERDLQYMGIQSSIADYILQCASHAKLSGLDGLVCSSQEVKMITENFRGYFKLLVPGIRPEGIESNDQKRIATPEDAVKLGANYIVIGRPITKAQSPRLAAEAIWESVKELELYTASDYNE